MWGYHRHLLAIRSKTFCNAAVSLAVGEHPPYDSCADVRKLNLSLNC